MCEMMSTSRNVLKQSRRTEHFTLDATERLPERAVPGGAACITIHPVCISSCAFAKSTFGQGLRNSAPLFTICVHRSYRAIMGHWYTTDGGSSSVKRVGLHGTGALSQCTMGSIFCNSILAAPTAAL